MVDRHISSRSDIKSRYESAKRTTYIYSSIVSVLLASSAFTIILGLLFGTIYGLEYYFELNYYFASGNDIQLSEVMPIVVFLPIAVLLAVTAFALIMKVDILNQKITQYENDCPYLKDSSNA